MAFDIEDPSMLKTLELILEKIFIERVVIGWSERGRGYVRVVVLYEEEIAWLQEMCRKEKKFFGGFGQLGCLRGGGRSLICSRTRKGDMRRLELRLFAPYGRRIVVIPEMVEGEGWIFFAEFLHAFLQNESIMGHSRRTTMGRKMRKERRSHPRNYNQIICLWKTIRRDSRR